MNGECIGILLRLGSAELREDFAVEEIVVEREMETVDTEFVEFEHAIQDGLRTADQAAGVPFVAVEQG